MVKQHVGEIPNRKGTFGWRFVLAVRFLKRPFGVIVTEVLGLGERKQKQGIQEEARMTKQHVGEVPNRMAAFVMGLRQMVNEG